MAGTNRNLELFKERIPKQFGGALLKGNAKCARPLSTKHAVHLVLKSELARGSRSFLQPKNAKKIDAIIRAQAAATGVRLYHVVNVDNHLHLVLKLPNLGHAPARKAFFNFVRAVTGLIARHVLAAEKNSPSQLLATKARRFWQARPFTRLVTWGRDFKRLNGYMEKNRTQARARRALIDWGFSVIDPDKVASLNSS